MRLIIEDKPSRRLSISLCLLLIVLFATACTQESVTANTTAAEDTGNGAAADVNSQPPEVEVPPDVGEDVDHLDATDDPIPNLPDTESDTGSDVGTEEPTDQSVEVLVMFLDTDFELGNPVDIQINGTWYDYQGRTIDDPIWDTHLGNSRGHIISLDEPLEEVQFDPDQLIVDGLNNHGFGFFLYRVQKRHPDTDLTVIDTDPDSVNYWDTGYDGFDTSWVRNGFNDTFAPDPLFYERTFVEELSDSGKVIIYIAGQGRNHPGLGDDEHPVADDDPNEPDPNEPDPNEPDPTEPDDPDDPVDVLIMFLDTNFEFTTPVDIRLNGIWYEYYGKTIDDPIWESSLHNARGHIITIDGPLTDVEFSTDQIQIDGLNNHGFGSFNYKILKRDAATDLTNLNAEPGNINYWAHHYDGILLLRHGYNGTYAPDPYFYNYDVPVHWSDNKKVIIHIGGHGYNHGAFGPDEHPE